jgi:hypothetical protein
MSATVVPFPERRYHPDVAQVLKVIDRFGKERGPMFDLAFTALKLTKSRRGNPNPTPDDTQDAINGMALALFALAQELGIHRSKLLASMAIDGGAA